MASVEMLILIISIVILVAIWCKYNYNYWIRHGIKQVNPTPFIGNLAPFLMLKRNFGLHLSDIYADKRYADEAVVGLYVFNKPVLLIRDLEAVKSVLIKDFNKFSNRSGRIDPHYDALGSNNLFFVRNPKWRETRTKLTPVYTSGKIKQMYPLMLEVANELEAHLNGYLKNTTTNSFVAEVKEICALYTSDLIASIAFGIRAYSLQNPQAEFRSHGRKFFEFDISRAKDAFIAFFYPSLATVLRARIFSSEFSQYLRSTIQHIMLEREKSGYIRNDLIDTLLALKRAILDETKREMLEKDEQDFLAAQAAVFITAGFETSSSTMSFALHELAKHPDVQTRLRAEIHDALLLEENGEISYEKIQALEYLGMVVDETLRLYPVLPFLDRLYKSAKDDAIYTFQEYPNYQVPEDLSVYIPIYGIQRDPKYWHEPNTFDPERFSNANKKNHHPMAYLPFGNGPHNCIGSRLGLLQVKIGLVHFLKNHYVTISEKTKINMDPKSIVLQATGGNYLNIVNDRMYANLLLQNKKI